MAKTIVAFPEEYYSIDVETTGLDFEHDEVIEVAAVHIVHGQVESVYSSLVKPERSHTFLTFGDLEKMGYASFSDVPQEQMDKFYATHLVGDYVADLCGITNEMLLTAPDASQVFSEFVSFVGQAPVVGHNITFDANFIKNACDRLGLDWQCDLIDTMRISRKLYPDMKHHRLADMCEALAISNDDAHRAESDARATATLFEQLRARVISETTIDMFVSSFVQNKHLKYDYSLKDIAPTVDEIDETNPLFGKIVVFTGALSSMNRKDAAQLVANCGGIPAADLTQKTNFLVVGNAEYIASVKDGKTSKMKKAEKYQAKGADLTVLSEKTFLAYIGFPLNIDES